MDPTANPALPLIIAAHQFLCGTCAWCRAGHGWPEQRQLTRGHWWLLEHHADPCCCDYVVIRTTAPYVLVLPDRRPRHTGYVPYSDPEWADAPGSHLLELLTPIASVFLIAPECPAHGHLRNAHLAARLWALARADAVAQGLSEELGLNVTYDTRPLLDD